MELKQNLNRDLKVDILYHLHEVVTVQQKYVRGIGVFRIAVIAVELVGKASFVYSFTETKLIGHSDYTTTRPQREIVYWGMPVSVVQHARNTTLTWYVIPRSCHDRLLREREQNDFSQARKEAH